jgi:hypothetical protein
MPKVPPALCVALLAAVAALSAAPEHPSALRLAVGDRLPALKGDLLSGKPGALPDLAVGRTTLIALGFSYDSRFQVERWAAEFRSRYRSRSDVTLFEVPMMGSAARLGRWFIDNGMRKNTPPELQDSVMTVYGSNDDWKARVGFARPDDAYLVLIDAKGVVRWLAHGPVSDDRLQDLSAVVDSVSQASPDRR